MSDLVDTNIFIHAADEDSNYHPKAKEFIDRCINDDQTWCFTWVNIFEFLRVATHPNIFNNPMKSDDAEKNISFFLSLPQTEILLEERNFFEVYRQLITETGEVSSNLVHDAHIAALMLQHGVKKIYTYGYPIQSFSILREYKSFKIKILIATIHGLNPRAAFLRKPPNSVFLAELWLRPYRVVFFVVR